MKYCHVTLSPYILDLDKGTNIPKWKDDGDLDIHMKPRNHCDSHEWEWSPAQCCDQFTTPPNDTRPGAVQYSTQHTTCQNTQPWPSTS
jgi:hypothetical protein